MAEIEVKVRCLDSIITDLSFLTRQILMKFHENLLGLDSKSVRFHIRKKRPQPAPPGCGLSTSATARKQPRGSQLLNRQSLQNCNHWQDKFFWCDHLPVENRKMDCENDKSSARSNGRDRPRVQRGGAT